MNHAGKNTFTISSPRSPVTPSEAALFRHTKMTSLSSSGVVFVRARVQVNCWRYSPSVHHDTVARTSRRDRGNHLSALAEWRLVALPWHRGPYEGSDRGLHCCCRKGFIRLSMTFKAREGGISELVSAARDSLRVYGSDYCRSVQTFTKHLSFSAPLNMKSRVVLR